MRDLPSYFTLTTDPGFLQRFYNYPTGDPHCHTVYSDGCVQILDLIKFAKKQKFTTIFKADHNTTRGNRLLLSLAREEGLIPIPGIELSITQAHMVAVNILEWPFKKKFDTEEAIEQIHKLGGAAIMAHPWWRIGLRESTFKYRTLDGFEGLNHASPFGSLIFLRKYYKRGIFENINPFQIPVWVGSDSHAGIVYGQYRMAFLTSDFSKDGIMEAIFHRKIRAYGPILPLWSWLRDGATNLIPQIKKKALKH